MEQRNKWQVKKVLTIVVLSIVAAGILFVALFFPIKAAYYLSGDRGGGRYVIFTDNFDREYRVDLPKGEEQITETVELDYDIDTFYTFNYKVYYSKSGKFTGEYGGYDYISNYDRYPNYIVYGGGDDYGRDIVTAYADYYDASGKVNSTAEISLKVRLKDEQPVPKSEMVIEKPGKYESFLWKNDTFATYTIKPGNGSYQVTVPEGWVFGVMVRDDNGKYIEENAYRTCRFTFDKEDNSKWIWIYREDPNNTERRFWVDVTRVLD